MIKSALFMCIGLVGMLLSDGMIAMWCNIEWMPHLKWLVLVFPLVCFLTSIISFWAAVQVSYDLGTMEAENPPTQKQGLKDHEIAQLVNAVRDNLKELVPHQCLREMVHSAMINKLEAMGRRIDKK